MIVSGISLGQANATPGGAPGREGVDPAVGTTCRREPASARDPRNAEAFTMKGGADILKGGHST